MEPQFLYYSYCSSVPHSTLLLPKMGASKLVLTWIILIVSVLPLCLASFRVINGKPIKITGAPYIAALISANSFSHICGGTIIAPKVIATAGHCVE